MKRLLIAVLAAALLVPAAASATPATSSPYNEWTWWTLDAEATYVDPVTIVNAQRRYWPEDYPCSYDIAIGPGETVWIGKGYIDIGSPASSTEFRQWGFAVFQDWLWRPVYGFVDTGYATMKVWGVGLNGQWYSGQYYLQTRRAFSDSHPHADNTYGLWLKVVNPGPAHFNVRPC